MVQIMPLFSDHVYLSEREADTCPTSRRKAMSIKYFVIPLEFSCFTQYVSFAYRMFDYNI